MISVQKGNVVKVDMCHWTFVCRKWRESARVEHRNEKERKKHQEERPQPFLRKGNGSQTISFKHEFFFWMMFLPVFLPLRLRCTSQAAAVPFRRVFPHHTAEDAQAATASRIPRLCQTSPLFTDLYKPSAFFALREALLHYDPTHM